MQKEFPKFRFHPNPIANYVIKESDTECPVCHQKTGYGYSVPFYTTADVENLCPWCIANGEAAKKYNGEFQGTETIETAMPQFDENGQYCGHSKPQIPEDELDELIHRTPGYFAWQQEEWLVHCNSPCAFIGYVGWNEIKDQLDRFIDIEKDCQRFNDKWGITELSENLFNGSSCQGYLFECIHCHGYRLCMDYD